MGAEAAARSRREAVSLGVTAEVAEQKQELKGGVSKKDYMGFLFIVAYLVPLLAEHIVFVCFLCVWCCLRLTPADIHVHATYPMTCVQTDVRMIGDGAVHTFTHTHSVGFTEMSLGHAGEPLPFPSS